MPKSRIKARLRPQRKQRLTTLEANFGGRLERATVDFFAISYVIYPFGLWVTILLGCLALRLSGTYQKKGARVYRKANRWGWRDTSTVPSGVQTAALPR